MNDRVKITIEDHVASVCMIRPEKQNALDAAMFEQLAEAGVELMSTKGVRAVVLQAEGDHFCAGIDTSVFSSGSIDISKMNPVEGSDANFFQRPAYVWRELPMPVICAVKGNTFGGGLQIALGADIRIAQPGMRMSVMEVRWGLIPDLAISTTLRHILPLDKAKELAFTGRLVEAEEAEKLGLVTAVVQDADAAAMALAQNIAGNSPDATRGSKKLMNEAWHLPEAESLRLEAEIQMRVMAGPNQREAVMSQMEKRPAEFEDS